MKSVLVTGGAKRVGAAISRRFADAGWYVVIHYHSSQDAAESLASELSSAETVRCDLADGNAAVAMIESLAGRLEDWRALVNNASVFDEDDVTGLDPDTARDGYQVNAVTPARMAQGFLAKAKSETGRHVIQITDQKLRNPNPDFFSYTMSKHATAAAAEMMAMAADGPDGVYTLAPGAILPSHDQSEEEAEKSHRMNLLRRRTRASEVADAAVCLASGHLASGQALYVDSGQHLLSQPRDVLYLARGER